MKNGALSFIYFLFVSLTHSNNILFSIEDVVKIDNLCFSSLYLSKWIAIALNTRPDKKS